MPVQLNVTQIEDLLRHYNAEQAKLSFQLQNTEAMITELENSLENARSREAAAVDLPAVVMLQEEKAPTKRSPSRPRKKGPGRPKKQKTAASAETTNQPKLGKAKKNTSESSASAGKRGRPAGSSGKLSDWDEALVTGIRNKGRIMTNPELLKIFIRKNKKSEIPQSEMELKGRLNRCLQKLANKKELLVKVPHEGKGFAYGLSSWIDKETGEMDAKRLFDESSEQNVSDVEIGTD